jgi:hypothetical protein
MHTHLLLPTQTTTHRSTHLHLDTCLLPCCRQVHVKMQKLAKKQAKGAEALDK